jgi:hypothetical protein
MVLLGYVVKCKLVSIHLEIVLISMQDRCTVWKLYWAHPMELLGDMGQMEAHFGRFGDSVNLHPRWVHS